MEVTDMIKYMAFFLVMLLLCVFSKRWEPEE